MNDWVSSCLKKHAYSAETARSVAARRTAVAGIPIDAYPCPTGAGHWHVGKRR